MQPQTECLQAFDTAEQTYRREAVLWCVEHPGASSQVVVLQRRAVIVGDGQWVCSLDQEVVVEASMLVVMHGGRPVGGQLLHPVHDLAGQHPPMAQQHVGHLHH